jgi:diaminopimelate decarboxylase
MGFDCSSLGELTMVERSGLGKNGLFYTSNNTPDSDYRYADKLGAIINVDKVGYVEQVASAIGRAPSKMAIRYNPGESKAGNAIIGNPKESKFGDTEEHVLEALKIMRRMGVEQIGIHTMVASNEKRPEYFADTARLLRVLAEKAFDLIGVEVAFLNIGGGIGVNYHPDEEPVDLESIGEAVKSELNDLNIPVVSENGRYVTGPHGYFLTRITHGIQTSHESFLQVDTSINNMARLATVTAAYHQLTFLGREADRTNPMSVTGSMCANSDKMFRDYPIPVTVQPGDLMVIHDAGAHMRANSHNYNFRPRAGEVLVLADGTHRLIRRHETVEDMLSTTEGL